MRKDIVKAFLAQLVVATFFLTLFISVPVVGDLIGDLANSDLFAITTDGVTTTCDNHFKIDAPNFLKLNDASGGCVQSVDVSTTTAATVSITDLDTTDYVFTQWVSASADPGATVLTISAGSVAVSWDNSTTGTFNLLAIKD